MIDFSFLLSLLSYNSQFRLKAISMCLLCRIISQRLLWLYNEPIFNLSQLWSIYPTMLVWLKASIFSCYLYLTLSSKQCWFVAIDLPISKYSIKLFLMVKNEEIRFNKNNYFYLLYRIFFLIVKHVKFSNLYFIWNIFTLLFGKNI